MLRLWFYSFIMPYIDLNVLIIYTKWNLSLKNVEQISKKSLHWLRNYYFLWLYAKLYFCTFYITKVRMIKMIKNNFQHWVYTLTWENSLFNFCVFIWNAVNFYASNIILMSYIERHIWLKMRQWDNLAFIFKFDALFNVNKTDLLHAICRTLMNHNFYWWSCFINKLDLLYWSNNTFCYSTKWPCKFQKEEVETKHSLLFFILSLQFAKESFEELYITHHVLDPLITHHHKKRTIYWDH